MLEEEICEKIRAIPESDWVCEYAGIERDHSSYLTGAHEIVVSAETRNGNSCRVRYKAWSFDDDSGNCIRGCAYEVYHNGTRIWDWHSKPTSTAGSLVQVLEPLVKQLGADWERKERAAGQRAREDARMADEESRRKLLENF